MSKYGPIIKIYKQFEIEKFFKVLVESGETFKFCKDFFPWKFEKDLRKKDVLKRTEYKNKVRSYVNIKNKEKLVYVLNYIENYK